MEKGYKNVVWIFIIITLVVFAGFSKTYFLKLGAPSQFSLVHHIHGVIMILWLALLIAQPILVSKKKIELHRKLGKLSYFLMPVLIFLMLLAYRGQYLNLETVGNPHDQNLALLLVPATDTLPFALLYLLAMVNRKQTAYHMRYIIASALVLIGPPLGRILMFTTSLDFMTGSLVTYAITDFILVIMMVYDRYNSKSFSVGPYFISLIILIICQTTLLYLPFTATWQSIATHIADHLL